MALRPPKSPQTAAGRAFEGAFEAAISVVVAMVGGYYADRWLGTEPVLVFVGLFLGGIAAVRRLLQLVDSAVSEAAERQSERQDGTKPHAKPESGASAASRGDEQHDDHDDGGSNGAR